MATLVIPTDTGDNVAPQVLSITLDGKQYQLTVRYNDRAGYWRIDVADNSGAALMSGLCVRNAGLPVNGSQVAQSGKLGGMLFAVPTSEPGRDADNSELGSRVLLTYVDAASLGA